MTADLHDVVRVILSNPQRSQSRHVSFEASVDGKPLLRSSVPIYDSARALLALGYDPDTMMTVRHAGKGFDSIKPAQIGDLAKWTVTEGDKRGLRLERWRPFPQKAPSRGAGLTAQRDLAPAGGRCALGAWTMTRDGITVSPPELGWRRQAAVVRSSN